MTTTELPKTIWLQWHGDSDECETGPVAESDVTHSREKIFPRDVEYVAAGKVDPDLVSLRIASLIADKAMIISSANRDLACYGEWRTDYNAWHEQAESELQALFSQADAIRLPDINPPNQ